jgi:hypothetical protein
MSVKTVRLDEQSERTLQQLIRSTGLTASALFKRGLQALREQMEHEESSAPFEVYRRLDLGPGGDAIADSTQVRQGVREAVEKKLGR